MPVGNGGVVPAVWSLWIGELWLWFMCDVFFILPYFTTVSEEIYRSGRFFKKRIKRTRNVLHYCACGCIR